MKCSGQIKIIGDEYCGFYSCGLTMLDSSTMGKFREECSEAPNDMLPPLHTVLKSEDDMAINVDYMPDMVNNAAHIQTTFTNNSDKPVTLEMITSFLIEGIKADKIHRFTSFWSAEGRHKVDTVNELNLEKSWNNMAVRVEKFGNVGSMPVRRYFPMVVLEDSSMSMFYGVQLYSPVSWQIEIVCRHDDTLTVAGGIADRDFGNWTKTVGVGETFVAPKAVAAMGRSLEEVCECLVKAQNPNVSPVDNKMGIVFNEYCATWGKPTSENLKTVVDKLEGKDIQFLVIDSGWYGKDDGYWWDYLGDWSINRNRFPNGLKETADYIRSKGMIPGIWFEFESVAPKCELFNQPEHLVKKDGVPLTIGGRRFLDMEDPWVISHLSKNVIDLLKEAGFGYIKVDYNDTMGMGCDGDESLGENLRRKVIATQKFFKKMKEEMPELVIENCSSGGHRLEPSMMELSSQASFSDAHEITSLPLIAANLQKMVKPSQNQIWAVMRAADSDERIYYSMCAPLLGRMGLSGDIYDLSEHQWKLIDEGMSFYKSVSDIIKDGRTVISKADTDSYNNPTGGQAVYRILGKNALIVYHRFGASVDYEEFVKGNNINFPEFDVLSTYGVADKDFSAMAMLVKLRISWDSHMFRENCIIADTLRDIGLTTPEDIERFDNIAYGDDPMQVMDVYRPKNAGSKKLPVIVSVHGGGWVYGNKEIYQYYCMNLAQRGFVAVNFSYRLAPEHKYPAAIEDTNTVFTWVMEHADEYGMDVNNIFAVGDSAGGQNISIYSCILTNPVYAGKYSFKAPEGLKLKAVGLNCGVYEASIGPVTSFMTDLLKGEGTDEERDMMSPAHYVTEDFPPSYVLTASHDFLKGDGKMMFELLQAKNVECDYKLYGSAEKPLYHVFHCDIKSEDAKQANDDEINFFKKYID